MAEQVPLGESSFPESIEPEIEPEIDPVQQELLALQEQYRSYYAFDPYLTDAGSATGQLGSWLAQSMAAIQTSEDLYPEQYITLDVAFPDPVCPTEAVPAWIVVLVHESGYVSATEIVRRTGYTALDNLGLNTVANQAHPPAPDRNPEDDDYTVYQYNVNFYDNGNCRIEAATEFGSPPSGSPREELLGSRQIPLS